MTAHGYGTAAEAWQLQTPPQTSNYTMRVCSSLYRGDVNARVRTCQAFEVVLVAREQDAAA